LVEGASGPGFNSWGIAGGFAALAGLAFMRLLSEVPTRGTRKENNMEARKGRHSSNTKKSNTVESTAVVDEGPPRDPVAAL
jgi:hypothetical protein